MLKLSESAKKGGHTLEKICCCCCCCEQQWKQHVGRHSFNKSKIHFCRYPNSWATLCQKDCAELIWMSRTWNCFCKMTFERSFHFIQRWNEYWDAPSMEINVVCKKMIKKNQCRCPWVTSDLRIDDSLQNEAEFLCRKAVFLMREWVSKSPRLGQFLSHPYCGILSRQNAGVFTEVQMQQWIGIVIAWTQGLGQRDHTWGGEGRADDKVRSESSEHLWLV